MIEETETGTSGYERTEKIIPAMEVSVSRGIVRRSRDDDIPASGAGKRRRFGSEDEEEVFQLQYRCLLGADINSVLMCSITDDSISDLKAECVSETDIFISSNDGFSRETSTSSVVCSESVEMQSLSTVTSDKKTSTFSRRKPPLAAVMMPSAVELEEFFSKAEKYEQKRFAEKYNFDIVKDVPMEGRYQWVPLKP